jgi:hypothetical protein
MDAFNDEKLGAANSTSINGRVQEVTESNNSLTGARYTVYQALVLEGVCPDGRQRSFIAIDISLVLFCNGRRSG